MLQMDCKCEVLKLQKTRLFHVRTSLERLQKSLEVIRQDMKCLDKPITRGQSLGREQELERVREISNMFDILPTLPDRPGNYK